MKENKVIPVNLTVNPSHDDFVLSEVSICASSNFKILGVKVESMAHL